MSLKSSFASVRTLLAAVFLPATASAGLIVTFQNSASVIGGSLDGTNQGTFELEDGVSITVNAIGGNFRASTSQFGVEQREWTPPPGCRRRCGRPRPTFDRGITYDDPIGFNFEQVGGPGIAEGLTISFDRDVIVNNLSADRFDIFPENAFAVTSGTSNLANISSSGTTSLGDYPLAANTDLMIRATEGRYHQGWSLVSIEVTAVPEPSGFILGGILVVSLAMRRKRQ